MLTPAENEQVLTWLYDLAGRVPFVVKATEAPFYRRIVRQHSAAAMPGRAPGAAGSLQEQSLADIYQNSPVFQMLRRPDLIKGKCGVCEFRALCGGSRSRAYALTGDYLASDPGCAYEPALAAGIAP